MARKKRNYRKEYDNYASTPGAKRRRAMNNKARRKMMRLGRVHKGDDKDVDHIDTNEFNASTENLRVVSKKRNRSFARTKTARRKRRNA